MLPQNNKTETNNQNTHYTVPMKFQSFSTIFASMSLPTILLMLPATPYALETKTVAKFCQTVEVAEKKERVPRLKVRRSTAMCDSGYVLFHHTCEKTSNRFRDPSTSIKFDKQGNKIGVTCSVKRSRKSGRFSTLLTVTAFCVKQSEFNNRSVCTSKPESISACTSVKTSRKKELYVGNFSTGSFDFFFLESKCPSGQAVVRAQQGSDSCATTSGKFSVVRTTDNNTFRKGPERSRFFGGQECTFVNEADGIGQGTIGTIVSSKVNCVDLDSVFQYGNPVTLSESVASDERELLAVTLLCPEGKTVLTAGCFGNVLLTDRKFTGEVNGAICRTADRRTGPLTAEITCIDDDFLDNTCV